MQANANRYSKNPYFLHSVCTPHDGHTSSKMQGSRAQSAKMQALNKHSRSQRSTKFHRASANQLHPQHMEPLQQETVLPQIAGANTEYADEEPESTHEKQ